MEAAAIGPTLDLEEAEWASGARWIAGIDEAGRGALAGPVVAGAVVLPRGGFQTLDRLSEVRDSKLMTPAARCRAFKAIATTAVGIGVGAVSAEDIDAIGILRATQIAMARAVAALPVVPDLLLIDGLAMPLLKRRQRAVVGGDGSVLSIAAASVAAKLHRDALMIALSGSAPDHGFDQHKGYCTRMHLWAIDALGPTRYHRLTWAPIAGVGLRVVGQPRLPGLEEPRGPTPVDLGAIPRGGQLDSRYASARVAAALSPLSVVSTIGEAATDRG